MPALSPTMEKGTIVNWCKKEGDAVSVGDILFEVETDKATVGYEVQDDGFLAKILVDAGSPDVPVGTPVAIIVEEEQEVKLIQESDLSEQHQQDAKFQQNQNVIEINEQQQQQQSNLPLHSKITMPSLSPTMTSGKVKEWLKKEGDFISAGDILCEIETDKASIGFEVQDDGYLAKILNSETGVEMQVGDIIAIIVDEESEIVAFKDYSGSSSDHQVENQNPVLENKVLSSDQKKHNQIKNNSEDRIFASPIARVMAKENQYDLSEITATGPSGRIIKKDIEAFKPSSKKAESPQVQQEKAQTQLKKPSKIQDSQQTNPFDEIPLSNMRKTIANRLLESKTTIPHYYVTKTVNMNESLKLRQILNGEEGVKVSVNDMLIKAASLACIQVPEVNSQWHGDHIKKFHNCDISVAVSTDSGLITPIVANANQKGLSEISKNVKDLAGRARTGALKPEEYIGGTFTISNLGMFGVDHFSAIINPPQACIMAVGKTEKKVVFDNSNPETPYKVMSQMTVTISCDHRVVDGAVAAQWLNHFANYLEKPYTMML